MSVLTKAHLDAFESKGYVAIEDFASRDEIAALAPALGALFDDPKVRAAGNLVDYYGDKAEKREREILPQVHEVLDVVPALAGTTLWRRSVEAVAELVGCPIGDVRYHASTLLRKGPRGAPEVPWHQDEAYHRPDEINHYIPIFVPLVDTTTDNGCMVYIPETHKGEVLPHRQIQGKAQVHGIEVDWERAGVDQRGRQVPAPLRMGGAVFHHIRAVHMTTPNISDSIRDCLVLILGPPSQRRPGNHPGRYPWNAEEVRDGIDPPVALAITEALTGRSPTT